MKKQDLRIGNTIKIDGLIVTVDERTLFDFDHDGRIKEGVPLTEDVFVRLGFKKQMFGYKHFNLDLYFYRDGEFWESEQLPMFVFIEHIHQLQNLYFALTGAELNLKN
jgi:hypothetical protein